MTTIRRLILELGVEGDVNAKDKLNDFNKSIDDVKKNLIELESHIKVTTETGGTQTPLFGYRGMDIIQSPQPLIAKGEQVTKEQDKETKERGDKQTELQEKMVDLLRRVAESLQDQFRGQLQLVQQITKESATESQIMSNVAKTSAQLIDEALEYVKSAKRPIGVVGRPPLQYEYHYDPVKGVPVRQETQLYAEYMRPHRELIAKLEEASEELPKIASALQKHQTKEGREELEQKFSEIQEMLSDTIKNIMGFKEKAAEITQTVAESEVKPFIPEGTQTKTTEKGGIKQDLSSRIRKIAHDIMVSAGIESKLSKDYPDIRRSKISEDMFFAEERRMAEEEAQKIRDQIKAELEHDREIRERGYAVMPIENLRRKILGMQERVEEFKDDLKEKMISILTHGGKSKFIVTADQYLGSQEEYRKAQAKELMESEEGAKIINNVVINNPVLKEANQQDELIKNITLALRGLK